MDETLGFRIEYLYHWAVIFAPMVLLACVLRRRAFETAAVSSVSAIVGAPQSLRQILRAPVLWLLFAGGIIALTIALSRPQVQSLLTNKTEARNLMLVLDVSKSMATVDFDSRGILSRIGGVKDVVAEFIKARSRDRLGLVVFGSSAYLQCPLTLDHSLIKQLVNLLQAGIAGDATAIGDGLGIALKRMRAYDPKTSAVILLTDGVNNSGQVTPLKAAELAREMGIKVHTIGIGSSGSQMGFFSGAGLSAEFDEHTLKKIAEITGGTYFNADSLEGLKEVYAEIDRLERSENEEPEVRGVKELFPSYTIIAAALLGTFWILKSSLFLKVPNG